MDEQKDQEEKKDQFDWQLMLFFVKIIRTVFLHVPCVLISLFYFALEETFELNAFIIDPGVFVSELVFKIILNS